MIINICTFTDKGYDLAKRLEENLTEEIVVINNRDNIDSFIKKSFEIKCPLIFIGAIAIAVRKIAPYIDSKLSDPPVIVIDERGLNVIPILSGHIGGANCLAKKIADLLASRAIITTATDIEGAFSVDVYAKDNNLGIVNKDGIKHISRKVLDNKDITIWDVREKGKELSHRVDVIINSERNLDYLSTLALYPKRYFLGIGCKKDTPYDKIERLADIVLEKNNIDYCEIAGIATIDIKRKEYGLNEYAHRHGLSITAFCKDELEKLKGDFTFSSFVKNTVGVDNVCERAAILAAGLNSTLIVKKTVLDGVSLAVAFKDR